MNRACTTTLARTALALAATALTTPALAAPPDYGLDFVTVGDPGNRGATAEEAPGLFGGYPGSPSLENPGAIGYEFRIMRNEVTISTWVDFLNAYTPYHDGPLIGFGDAYYGAGNGSTFTYTAGTGDYPATGIGWHTAARFCNWLHNGKVNEAWAFETGAYDTSHFQPDENGKYQDSNVRLPGAKYWIPSVDEYIKAAYYDPNRHGEGQPGYWLYPHMSDEPVTPEQSDVWFEGEWGVTPWIELLGQPVGQYPDVQSPWGLLGVSGGAAEWLEDHVPAWDIAVRRGIASQHGMGEFAALFDDRLDDWNVGGGFSNPYGASYGLRIASIVPSPGALGVFLIVPLLRVRPRRR